MTSICNYSHPEQQITTGLTRQTSGTLFPYNPEFYALTSGLYGPGTVFCWYLLLVSVIINWSLHPKNDEGYRRPGVSNDLLAALAYPLFAATDALIHGFKFFGTEYRALALFCLRNPAADLTGFGTFNHTQLNLSDIPPDIVKLGQRAIDLGGPLPVCYTFTGVMFIELLADFYLMPRLHLRWKPTKWAQWLAYGTYGYVVLLMTIFLSSLADFGISMFISLYEAIMPFWIFVMLFLCLFVPLLIIGNAYLLVLALCKRDSEGIVEGVKNLLAGTLFTMFPAMMIWSWRGNVIHFVPDIGVSLRERDQVAALLGGITTLVFTVGHLLRRYDEKNNKKKENDAEEFRTLVSHAH